MQIQNQLNSIEGSQIQLIEPQDPVMIYKNDTLYVYGTVHVTELQVDNFETKEESDTAMFVMLWCILLYSVITSMLK